MADNSQSYLPQKLICERHADDVLTRVYSFKEGNKYCDVTLIAEKDGKSMAAHRLVLSACSVYLENILNEKSLEVVLPVDGDILSALMDYWYTGEILIRGKTVLELLKAAYDFSLDPLVRICCQYVTNHINESNCLDIMSFAKRTGIDYLLAATEYFVRHNFTKVARTKDFLKLNFVDLRDIIASEELHVKNEEDVFNHVLSWIQCNSDECETNIPELVKHLRLSLLPASFFPHRLSPIIQLYPDCQKIIINAMQWHFKDNQLSSDRPKPRKWTPVIMLLGGESNMEKLSSITCYCPQLNRWTRDIRCNSLSEAGKTFSVEIQGEQLIAGSLDSGKAHIMNLNNFQWKPIASMKRNRAFFGFAALNNFLYVIGGSSAKSTLKTVERIRLNPFEDTWEYVAAMSIGRTAASAAALKGLLYVVGGNTSSHMATEAVECYNPEANAWTKKAKMKHARANCSVVAGHDYLYVLGGQQSIDLYLDTVERYDPHIDQWVMLCSLSVARSDIAALMFNNRLLVIGGKNKDKYYDLMEQYDTKKNKWIELEPPQKLQKCVSGASAVAIPNIYIQHKILEIKS